MRCSGCGNEAASIVRMWYNGNSRFEVCDKKDCGNLRMPMNPDVYFRRPYMDQNLGDANSPQGILIESRRHKAEVLSKQGLREDGDRVHGSVFRDAKAPKRELSQSFRKKVRDVVRQTVKKANRK